MSDRDGGLKKKSSSGSKSKHSKKHGDEDGDHHHKSSSKSSSSSKSKKSSKKEDDDDNNNTIRKKSSRDGKSSSSSSKSKTKSSSSGGGKKLDSKSNHSSSKDKSQSSSSKSDSASKHKSSSSGSGKSSSGKDKKSSSSGKSSSSPKSSPKKSEKDSKKSSKKSSSKEKEKKSSSSSSKSKKKEVSKPDNESEEGHHRSPRRVSFDVGADDSASSSSSTSSSGSVSRGEDGSEASDFSGDVSSGSGDSFNDDGSESGGSDGGEMNESQARRGSAIPSVALRAMQAMQNLKKVEPTALHVQTAGKAFDGGASSTLLVSPSPRGAGRRSIVSPQGVAPLLSPLGKPPGTLDWDKLNKKLPLKSPVPSNDRLAMQKKEAKEQTGKFFHLLQQQQQVLGVDPNNPVSGLLASAGSHQAKKPVFQTKDDSHSDDARAKKKIQDAKLNKSLSSLSRHGVKSMDTSSSSKSRGERGDSNLRGSGSSHGAKHTLKSSRHNDDKEEQSAAMRKARSKMGGTQSFGHKSLSSINHRGKPRRSKSDDDGSLEKNSGHGKSRRTADEIAINRLSKSEKSRKKKVSASIREEDEGDDDDFVVAEEEFVSLHSIVKKQEGRRDSIWD